MQNGDAFNQLEILDRYLEGELPEAEARQLSYKLEQDKTLRQQLDLLILSRDAIQSEALKQKMRRLHQENVQAVRDVPQRELPEASHRSPRPLYTWPLRAAAALLIGMLGYTAIQYALLSPAEIYEGEYLRYRLPVSRSSSSYPMTRLDSLYLNQDYQAVTRQFEAQAEKSRRDYFLAGVAYLENDAYRSAIDNFLHLQQAESQGEGTTFLQEADYYLALAYLKDGQLGQAFILFENIHQNPDHLYHARVSSTDLWKLQLLKSKQ